MFIYYSKNLIKIIKSILSKIYNSFFLKKNICWNIAFFRNSFENINLDNVSIINNPKNRWFADPFFVQVKKNYYIFFEDYNIKKKIGSISCAKINKDNSLKIYRDIIKEKFHLSFPFTFEYNKELFIIPESKDDNSIKLYKCTKFPNKWVFVKDLIKDIDGVDSIIFKHKKLWYLITCLQSKKNIYNRLIGFYSKNPIEGKWIKVKKFPLIKNNLSERNGGLICGKNRKLFRVGQIHLPSRYGYGYSINKLKNISKSNYQEDKINVKTELDNFKHIHTVNSKKNFTVIDYSKWK